MIFRLFCAAWFAVFALPPPSAPGLDFVSGDWQMRYLQARESWGSLRLQIAFNDTNVPDSQLADLKDTVVPVVTRWYQKVLRVPNLASPLKLSARFCGQAVIPALHATQGVLADAIIYVVTVPSKLQLDDLEAYGTPCLLSTAAPKRVIAGSVWLTMDYWVTLTANAKITLLTHLFAHVLAFNSVLYPHFTKPDGSLYADSEVLKSVNVGGSVHYVLALPTVVSRAQRAFDCPSLTGVRLAERSDPDAYFLSHWSSKMMLNDFMSDLILDTNVGFSDITMAVFQDSGWYEVQWKYTTQVQFGLKRGCAFFNSLCIVNKQPSFPEFCIVGSDLCSPTFTSRGQCTLTNYQYGIPSLFQYFDYFRGGPAQLDYCPVAAYSNSCVEGVSTVVGEEKCKDCKCFAGVYYPTVGTKNLKTSHCHRVKCSAGVAHVSIGSATVDCPPSGGSVTIPGYTGSLYCSPFPLLCASLPCKNLCSGFGICTAGSCVCEAGHTGEDCSQQCDVSCAQCSGPGADQCVECRPGAGLLSGACVCNAGLTMTKEGFCTSDAGCDPSCVSCSGPKQNECTSCKQPAALIAGSCVCPTGSVASTTGGCVNCAVQCKTCKNPEIGICLDCYDAAVLGTDPPYCKCPQGLFDASTRQCLSCDLLCATCSASPSTCDSCFDGFELVGSTCVCPAGSSNYIMTTTCSPCHTECRSCSGLTSLDCLSCADDAFLPSRPGRCLCRSATSQNCIQCVINKDCAACIPPATYACSSCYANANLDLQKNTCVCKAGYFPNPDASLCSPCHPSCLTCFADHYLACYSCPAYSFQNGSQCVCTTSYYADADTKSCQPCSDTHCLICDKTRCYHCIYGLDFDQDNKCVLRPGFFYDEGTKTTYACPNFCITCPLSTGKVPTCASCKYATMAIDTGKNLCACPAATFLDTVAEVCQPCAHAMCLACTAADTCSQCKVPYVVATTVLCACPSHMYELNGDCKTCDASCTTCSGPDASHCTSCPSSSFLVSGNCLCLSTSTSTTCRKCAPDCLTCSPSKLDTCLTCASTATLDSGTCKCKEGYYTNKTALNCGTCSRACYSCLGPSVTDCILCASKTAPVGGICECPSGYGFSGKSCIYCSTACRLCATSDYTLCTLCSTSAILRDGKCFCKDGYAAFALDPLQCNPCDFACLTCRALTAKDCTLCHDSTAPVQGVCQCPAAYAMSATNSCVPCHTTCSTCSGQGFTACTACYTSGSLENGICVCSPNRLVGQKCTKCSASCKECSETGVCKSCYSNASASSNECICDAGFFPDLTPANCSRCHKACWSCSGPNPTNCTSCRSYAVLTSDNQCVCTGLTTQTQSGSCYLRTYLCADERCTQCRDPIAYNLAQSDSYNDVYGSCGCRAADHFYVIPSRISSPSAALAPIFNFFDSFFYYYSASDLKAYYEDEMAGECLECSSICRGSCAQSAYDCWLCAPHAKIVISDLVTRCVCLQGYYFNGNECLKCMSGCLLCSSAENCSSCTTGYELVISAGKSQCKCVLPACLCPAKTFLFRATNACESICPSGYVQQDSECKEGPTRTFRFVLSTLMNPITDQTSRFFIGAVDNSSCGGFSYPPASMMRLYQRGFWFKPDLPQCITLTPDSPDQFIFAPTHFVEMWVRATEVVAFRYPEDYYVSTERSKLLYMTGNVVAFLNDNSKASKPMALKASVKPTSKWTLLRYQFLTQTINNQISTLISSYQDSILLNSVLINEYYFRDAPLDGRKAAFKITAVATGGAMMYEVTLGNREWQQQAATPCGCTFCTVSGDCLTTCAPLEFQQADKTCASCNATCTSGCVRASNCEMTTDSLCTLYLSFDQCLACKLLSRLNAKHCECVPHSVYSSEVSECVCQAPYQPFAFTECRKCLPYLENRQVAAEIAEDFLSLTLTFAVELNITADVPCADYFQASTFAKFGDQPTCIWDLNGRYLKILLGAQATILPEKLSLNTEILLKKYGVCSFNSETLEPFAVFRGDLPVPDAQLTAPTTVSLNCSSTVTVSALATRGSRGRFLSYKWLFFHDSLGLLFPQYSTYSPDFVYLTLPLASLLPGRLSVELSVLNGFEKVSIASSAILLTGEKALSLELEGGGNLTVTTQSVTTVAAFVRDDCAASEQSAFAWTYEGAEPPLNDTDPSPAALLANSPVLVVPKGALAGGRTYRFAVTAQKGTLNATAVLSLRVQFAPLVIRLNREGSAHPNDQNLLLDASGSEDPDSLPGAIAFFWACVLGEDECVDSTRKPFVTDLGSPKVFVTTNKMSLGAKYNFTVSLYKDDREASRSISIEIVKTAGLFAVFPALPDFIVPAQAFSLTPSIETSLMSKFQWSQIAGSSVTPDTPLTYPFLAFSPGSLSPGQSYTFAMTGSTFRGGFSIGITFPINRAPIGGSLSIQPTSGIALVDLFTLIASGWEDPEENYPLMYLFCIDSVCGGRRTLTPWLRTKLPVGTLTVSVQCLDSQGASSNAGVTLTVYAKPGRELSSGIVTEEFITDVGDGGNECGLILAYLRSVTVSQELAISMLDELEKLAAATSDMEKESLECALTAIENLLETQTKQSERYAKRLVNVAKTVSEKLDRSKLTVHHLEAIVRIATRTNSNEAWNSTKTWIASAIRRFTLVNLPDQSPVAISTPGLAVFMRRLNFDTLSLLTSLSIGNVSIAMKQKWVSDPAAATTGNSVVDWTIFVHKQNGTSWTLESEVWEVGNYSRYNFNLFDTWVRIDLPNFNSPVNVTLPRTSDFNTDQLECWITMSQTWKRNLCRILSVSAISYTVSTNSLSGVTVQKKLPDEPLGFSWTPPDVVLKDEDCGLNPAPLALNASFLFVSGLLFAIVIIKSVTKRLPKTDSPAESCTAPPLAIDDSELIVEVPNERSIILTETPRSAQNEVSPPSQNPNPSYTNPSPRDFASQSDGSRPSGSIESDNIIVDELSVQSESQSTAAKSESGYNVYLELARVHLALGVYQKTGEAWARFLLFLLALQVESVVLGLIYAFWYNGATPTTDAGGVWKDYSNKDFAYACIAMCGGTIVSSLLQVLLHLRRSAATAVIFVCAVTLVLQVMCFGAVVYLNIRVCWLPGGLWAESLLWAALGQFFFIESAKALIVTLVETAKFLN